MAESDPKPAQERPTYQQIASADGHGTSASNNLHRNSYMPPAWFWPVLIGLDFVALCVILFWSSPAKGH